MSRSDEIRKQQQRLVEQLPYAELEEAAEALEEYVKDIASFAATVVNIIRETPRSADRNDPHFWLKKKLGEAGSKIDAFHSKARQVSELPAVKEAVPPHVVEKGGK